MKTLKQIAFLAFLVFTAQLVAGQEEKPQNSTTKANHNTARSNKTTIAAPDKNTGGDVSTDTGNAASGTKATDYNSSRSNRTTSASKLENNSSEQSKKGYDYYKAQSDQGSTKAQDHNSSRSNKTASKVNPDDGSGSGDEKNTDVDKKTDKNASARSKKK